MVRNNTRPTLRELYPAKEIFQMLIVIVIALVLAVFFAWLVTSVR